MTISVLSVTAVMPTLLQCLDVPIIDDQDCKNAYPDMISPRMVCAGFMDGGRDVCNVSFTVNAANSQLCVCVRINHMLTFTPSVFVRATPAALWCVPESSMAWCHGVRDVLCQTTPESTSKCVSSIGGFKKPWQQTPEEITHFSLYLSSLPPLVLLNPIFFYSPDFYFSLSLVPLKFPHS